MILLQSAYKILITRMRFKRRTISVTPFTVRAISVPKARLCVYGASERRSIDADAA
jgi:hypothetical protein